MTMPNITPTQVKSRLDSGEALVILDIREEWEVETAALAGVLHIPMDNLPAEVERLPKESPLVIMCHHGNRGEQVAWWLMAQGYTNILNMMGGINQWSSEVDPAVPTY